MTSLKSILLLEFKNNYKDFKSVNSPNFSNRGQKVLPKLLLDTSIYKSNNYYYLFKDFSN